MKWCKTKITCSDLYALKGMLASIDEIYTVFLWTIQSFPFVIPKGILKLFKSFAKPSPVCSYFPQGKHIENLSIELFNPEVKSNISVLSKIRNKIPIFYHVLIDLFEPCLSIDWKPLVQYLISELNLKHFVIIVNIEPWVTCNLFYQNKTQERLHFNHNKNASYVK